MRLHDSIYKSYDPFALKDVPTDNYLYLHSYAYGTAIGDGSNLIMFDLAVKNLIGADYISGHTFIPAGTYRITADSAVLNSNSAFLYMTNFTDSSTILQGISNRVWSGWGSGLIRIDGVVTFTQTAKLGLYLRVESSTAQHMGSTLIIRRLDT